MDILDIFLDILLKPPQPLMGLFFSNSCSLRRKNFGAPKVEVGAICVGNAGSATAFRTCFILATWRDNGNHFVSLIFKS